MDVNQRFVRFLQLVFLAPITVNDAINVILFFILLFQSTSLALFIAPFLLIPAACLGLLIYCVLKTPKEIAKRKKPSVITLLALVLGTGYWIYLLFNSTVGGGFMAGPGEPMSIPWKIGLYLLPTICAIGNFAALIVEMLELRKSKA